MTKTSSPRPNAAGTVRDELARLKTTVAEIQEMRSSAQRELEIAKQLRAEAQKYQQETAEKAQGDARQLIQQTRLATRQVSEKEIKELIHQEIEELIHRASAEIQKMLADIRTIRITAQEELATQRRITDSARAFSLASAREKDGSEPDGDGKKLLTRKK